ncbi:MAG: hypothetical protein JNL80_02500 [Phycisphaerae bacterium]|jgi:hypothetical protein|nr:hypothetical protein [Phycisphaerae bacterium]
MTIPANAAPFPCASRHRSKVLLAALVLGACVTTGATAGEVCPCLGDLTANGEIGADDLAIMLGAWGNCRSCANCPADLSGDCKVDATDLAILLGGWGPCGPTPANDHCTDASDIVYWTGSANPFCTIGADTDGPPSTCGVPSITAIDGDVWYRFYPSIDGTVQIGVCADFDVRIAVYGENIFGNCACPGGLFGAPLLGCAGTSSFYVCDQAASLLVPVTGGDCYLLRVGGAPGQRGKGNIDLNFFVPPCEIASSTKLAATGIEADTEYGIAVDISGDLGVAGAIFDDILFGMQSAGTARVYRYQGNTWTPEVTLIAPEPFASQRFGVSLAASGDRIAVGAADVEAGCLADPNCDTGAVHLYAFDGTSWSFDQSLVPASSDADPLDKFGSRVDIDGNRVIVGAWDDSNANGTRAGAAYVYRPIIFLGAEIWIQDQKLIASNGDDFDNFASDVGVSGSWALVGADTDELGGSAYLFEEVAGTWVQQQMLHPTTLAASADFGYSVAIDGDIAVIGAPDFGAGPGKVYVYERFAGLGWLLTATLTAHDGANNDRFGASVSIEGEKLIVGAPGNLGGRGAAYLYWRVFGGWVERSKLVAGDAAVNDSFGGSVAVTGEVGGGLGLIGSYLDDVGAATDAGSVYRFNGLFECTGNGVAEACDIADNGLSDADADGIPDICEP